jgi:hypothetical protein
MNPENITLIEMVKKKNVPLCPQAIKISAERQRQCPELAAESHNTLTYKVINAESVWLRNIRRTISFHKNCINVYIGLIK